MNTETLIHKLTPYNQKFNVRIEIKLKEECVFIPIEESGLYNPYDINKKCVYLTPNFEVLTTEELKEFKQEIDKIIKSRGVKL